MIQTHDSYRLQVRLLSEAIFSSGEKEPNLVQSKVMADRHGFVYYHAKTLKGQLKRQAFWVLKQYMGFDPTKAASFLHSIAVLFGLNKSEIRMLKEDWKQIVQDKGAFPQRFESQGIMKLGHLMLPQGVRAYYRELISEQDDGQDQSDYVHLSQHDLIEAQTHIRTIIQLENGIVKDHMLATCHTVRKGLIFHAELSFEQDPSAYLQDLKRMIYSMDRLGAGIHRGYGEIEAELLIHSKQDNEDLLKGAGSL